MSSVRLQSNVPRWIQSKKSAKANDWIVQPHAVGALSESQKLWAHYLAIRGSLDPEPDTQNPFYNASTPGPRPIGGGQACVFYGAAEFSRDTDLVLLSDADNLDRLRRALGELQADCIAVPPLTADFLDRGHAVHFRCKHPEAAGMRVDRMSRLRGRCLPEG